MLSIVLLAIGGVAYTVGNVLAYDTIVEDNKKRMEKNKENKGFKKFLNGALNVIEKTLWFPAFTSKSVIKNSIPEYSIPKKITKKAKKLGLSQKEVNLAKYYALQQIKEAREDGSKMDFNGIRNRSLKIATDYELSTIIKNFDVKSNYMQNISTLKKDIYSVEEDTIAHKTLMQNLEFFIDAKLNQRTNELEKINPMDNYKVVEKQLAAASEKVIDIEDIYAEVHKRIQNRHNILKNEVVAYEEEFGININNLEDSLKTIDGHFNSVTEMISAYDLIKEIYSIEENLKLEELVENNEKEIIELSNFNASDKEELMHMLDELNIKFSLENQLMDMEQLCAELPQIINDTGVEENERVSHLLDLAKKIQENERIANVKIKGLSVVNKVCNETLIPSVELLLKNDENLKYADLVNVIVDKNINSLRENQKELIHVEAKIRQLKEVRNDMFCLHIPENKNIEELKSMGYYVYEDAIEVATEKYNFTEDENSDLKEQLDKLVGKYPVVSEAKVKEDEFLVYMNSLINTRYLGFSEEIKKEETIENEIEEAIEEETLNNLEELVKEFDENIDENKELEEEKLDNLEELKEEVVEEEPADLVEEPKEVEIEEEPKVLATSLTGDGAQVIAISDAPEKFKKVNYRKYELGELTENEYKKLNDKQKFIYDLIEVYGSEGLPVGIFTAMGVKMSQVKKFVKPIGEKYEADYTKSEQSKVENIIERKLNHDLYVSTNGNERIQVIRDPIQSINVTKTRIEVIDNINSKHKVCLVKGLTIAEKDALKQEFGDKIEIYKDYIIFNNKEKNIAKATKEILSRN